MAAPDFKRVFKRPQRSSDAFFTVLAYSHGHGPGRLGLAISKKQIKRAIDRNRLKRLIREAFRHRRHELAGSDLVVLARPAAASTDNVRLADSIARQFNQLVTVSTDKPTKGVSDN